jgi:hypothetical protein
MPVAAPIVVGPGIEVKPVESNSLRTYRNGGEERTNLAIEAILVHAEIGGRVAQPNEARQQPRWLGEMARSPWERTRRGRIFDHRRLEPVVPVVQGQVVTCGNYARKAQESRFEFRAIFSRTQTKRLVRGQDHDPGGCALSANARWDDAGKRAGREKSLPAARTVVAAGDRGMGTVVADDVAIDRQEIIHG